MTEVIRAAAELQKLCLSQSWRFCFIGGVALQRWGEPRETVDVDLTLFTGYGTEEAFIQVLLQHFEARIPDAERFARDRRVLLLRSDTGVGLDLSLAGLAYEELMIERASDFEYPSNTTLRTCSAEDLIVLKAFAGRSQDWVDVEKVIIRQTGTLDWEYIFEQLTPLSELKDSPEILEGLQRRRIEFEQ